MFISRFSASQKLCSYTLKRLSATTSASVFGSQQRNFAVYTQRLDKEVDKSSGATFEPKNFSNNEKGDLTFEFKMDPIPRPNEPIETKRARLLYQSRKRGILESDLILSKFASLYLKDMTLEELVEYDRLLDENDWDIYYWVTKNEDVKPCPEEWKKSKTMLKLQEMVKNHGRECIRMPDLY